MVIIAGHNRHLMNSYSVFQYLAELTMIESEPFLNYLPSVIAASAICLANITLEQEPWVS